MSTARHAVSAFCLATLGACAGMRAATAPAGPALPPESFALAGGSVAIHDPAGSVRVEPGSGPDVRVKVTRYGADGDRLRVEREARAGGDILRIRAEGPASRRLLYPGMPGRSDSIQFRATSSGFAPGRGGFLGLFGGRSMKVVRRPGKAPATEAHADMVVSVPPGRRVDLHVGAGAVAVTGDAGELHVRSLVGDFDLPSAAGRIFVASNFGGVFGRGGSGELTVTSRAGSVDLANFTGSRVEVTTAAGSIRGAALSASQLRLRAGAGDIDVAGARGGSVQLRSGSGRVTARDLVADTLLAMSEIGDLALPGLRAGTALLRTRRGDVLADLAAVPSLLRVVAHGGVMLRLPVGAAAELALESEHGRVRLEREPPAGASTVGGTLPGARGARGDRSLVTRLGAGGGRIEVRAERDIVLQAGPPGSPAEAVSGMVQVRSTR